MTACSGFMQHGPKLPDSMQWIPFSVIECRGFLAFWRNGSRLYAVESIQRGPMHPVECSGFYAAWPKTSRLSQWISCSVVQLILIECTNSMHQGAMVPD